MFRRFSIAHIALILITAVQVGTGWGCGRRTVTHTLLYEIDPRELQVDGAQKLASEVLVINERLQDAGKAYLVENNQIAVDLYGALSAEQIDALKTCISTVGVVEFRIAASSKHQAHQPAIDLATALPPDQTIVRLAGKDVARWLEFDLREFRDATEARQRGLIVRESTATPQALVMIDDGLDVTGDYFSSAGAGNDENGQRQIEFAFNAEGALLFGQLTGSHLPTADGRRHHLAIMLDNCVLSAPMIESKITDRARISGSATRDVTSPLLAVIQAGRLPFPIHLVSEGPIND